MNKEKKEQIKRNVKKAALICVGVAASVTVGIVIGEISTIKRISNGIGKLWEHDPTLKDHMWKALNEAVENEKV